MAMTYGSIYVAQVAMGASDAQTVKASWKRKLTRTVAIIAYSHCIATVQHGQRG